MKKFKNLLALCLIAALIVGTVNVAVANKTNETDRKTHTTVAVEESTSSEEQEKSDEEEGEASSIETEESSEKEEGSSEERETSGEESSEEALNEEEEESGESGSASSEEESTSSSTDDVTPGGASKENSEAFDEGEEASKEASDQEEASAEEVPKKLQKRLLLEDETENRLNLIVEEALKDKDSATIVLEENGDYIVSGHVKIPLGKTVELDLNGAEVNLAGFAIAAMGKLTINDRQGTAIVNSTSQSLPVLQVSTKTDLAQNKDAVLILNGGTYNGLYGVNIWGDHAHLIINDGVTINTKGYTIATNGTVTQAKNQKITINGGNLSSEGAVCMYLPTHNAKVQIKDGTFEGLGALQLCGSGTLDISGGEFIATYQHTEFPNKPSSQGDGSVNDGAAISLISRGDGYQSEGDKMKVRITGGTFTSDNNAVVSIYRLQQDPVTGKWVTNESTEVDNYLGSVEVTGGEFTANGQKPVFEIDPLVEGNVSDQGKNNIIVLKGGTYAASSGKIEEAYLADGFLLEKDENGNYVIQKPFHPEEKPEEPETSSRPSHSGGSVSNAGVYYADGRGSGAADPSIGTWKQDATGWWFVKADGSYPKNQWYECTWNGKKDWYHFDAEGYMDEGWFKDRDGSIYFLHNVGDNTRGHMYTGICEIDGYSYYFNEQQNGNPYGAMLTGWQWIGGKRYYFNSIDGQDGLPYGAMYQNRENPYGDMLNEKGEWVNGGIVVTKWE